MNNRVSVVALCVGVAATFATPAHAQEASGTGAQSGGDAPAQASTIPAAAPDQNTAGSPADIVVTAQGRSERLLDVPISITAVGGGLARDLGAESTRDLSQLVPGLIVPSQGVAVQPSIRGITSLGTSAGDEPNVATYIDDFYVASAYESVTTLADVERIEVLKGPQGTLFGRNATGGAIRIVTRQPQFTPEAHFAGSYGFDFDETKLSAFVTGPITRSIAASLSANYDANDGFVRNIYTGHRAAARDVVTVRGRLLLKPSSNFSAVLTGSYSGGDDAAVFALAPFDNNSQYYNNPKVVKPNTPEEISSSVDPFLHFRTYGTQLNADLDLSFVELKSITGYRYSRAEDGFDSDRTSLSLNSSFSEITTRELSQEVNFATPAGNRVALTGGVYYFHSDGTYISTGFTGDFRYEVGVTPAPIGTLNTSVYSNVVTESLAGFEETTLNVTNSFKLIGGIRYTTEQKTFNFHDLYRQAGIRTITDAERTFNSLTYRAIAQYEFSPDFNVYASFNTGFKSGVFASLTFPTNVVDPEKINAYEIGTKAKLGRLIISAAAFHYDYSDIQLQARDLVNGVLTIQLFNAATAKVDGAELSLSGPVSNALSFNAGLSWLPTAKYVSFPNSQVTIPRADNLGATTITPYDASGSRMIRAPKLTANLGAAFSQPLARGTLLLAGNVAYNSGFNFQIADLGHQKAYTVVNGSIGWRLPGEKATVSVFAENLFDARYGIYRAFGTIGTSQSYARPRLIGVKLQFDFK